MSLKAFWIRLTSLSLLMHQHTIISHGLSVSLREIVVTAISDHLPIVFDLLPPHLPISLFPQPTDAKSLLHKRPESLLSPLGTLNCMLTVDWFLPFVQTPYSPLYMLCNSGFCCPFSAKKHQNQGRSLVEQPHPPDQTTMQTG